MLRDKIILNKSIFLLGIDCRGCGLKDHLIENCEKIHLVMNRDIKIRQHLYSTSILERKVFLRRRKKINCFNIVKNKYFKSVSNVEGSFIQEEEKENGVPQTFERFSDFEINEENITSLNSKKEISYPSLSNIDPKNEILVSKRETNILTQSINDTNKELRSPLKRSNTSINTESAEIIFDKLQNYNYYYPDFNFENINKTMMTARKKKKTHISMANGKNKHKILQ